MLTGALQPARMERYVHGAFSAEILLPSSAEDLIDDGEFHADERLPYWAELWPAGRSLAAILLDEPQLPSRVIELGCGVGLPSLALRWRGVEEVVASDYYEDALRYVAENARHNGIPAPDRLLLDWRQVPAALPRFPLAIAADVLYEERNIEPLAAVLERTVAPNGAFLLSDPGRVHLTGFLTRMTHAGWKVAELAERMEESPAGNEMQVRVRLFRLSRLATTPTERAGGHTLPVPPPSLT